MLKLFFALLLTGILTACSILPPIKTETPKQYVINTIPAHIPHRDGSTLNLLINKPRTNPFYNTTQIAYSEKPFQISYFVKSRWAETPSQMLYPLIVQTLEATHSFHSIGIPSSLAQYDFIINTNILELQQNYVRNPPVVSLKMQVDIVNAKNNTIVDSEEFSVTQNISQDNPYAGTVATNQATAILLEKLAGFILRTLC
jgi:cholesterol transport system auxiliary component